MNDWKNFDLSALSSMDDLDLAMMGLLPTEEEPEAPEEAPAISPFHDMDSIEFHLWMEEEVDKEAARRKAQKKTEKAPAKEPKKPE